MEKRAKVDPARNFNGYIYRIARNAVIDHIRTETARSNYTSDYGVSFNDIDPVNSEDIVVADEVELIIKLTIASMPEQRRRIHEMRHYEGLSNEEIAERLCIQKATVAKQLTYGRADIRNALLGLLLMMMMP